MSQWKPDQESNRVDLVGGITQEKWRGMNLLTPPHLMEDSEFQLLENARWRGARLVPRGGQGAFSSGVVSADHFLWNGYGFVMQHGGVGGIGALDNPEAAPYKPTPVMPTYYYTPLIVTGTNTTFLWDAGGTPAWAFRDVKFMPKAASVVRHPGTGTAYKATTWTVNGSSLFHRDDGTRTSGRFLLCWTYFDNVMYFGFSPIDNGRKNYNQVAVVYALVGIPESGGSYGALAEMQTAPIVGQPAYDWYGAAPTDANAFGYQPYSLEGGRDGVWMTFTYHQAFVNEANFHLMKYDPTTGIYSLKKTIKRYPASTVSPCAMQIRYYKSAISSAYDRILACWHFWAGSWEQDLTPCSMITSGSPAGTDQQVPTIYDTSGGVVASIYKDNGATHNWVRGDDGGGTSAQYAKKSAFVNCGYTAAAAYLGGRLYLVVLHDHDYGTFVGFHLYSYGDGEVNLRWERSLNSTYSRLGAVANMLGTYQTNDTFRVCLASLGGYIYYLYKTYPIGAGNNYYIGRFDGTTWDDTYLNVNSDILGIGADLFGVNRCNAQIRVMDGSLWFTVNQTTGSVVYLAKSNGSNTAVGQWTSWAYTKDSDDSNQGSALVVWSE